MLARPALARTAKAHYHPCKPRAITRSLFYVGVGSPSTTRIAIMRRGMAVWYLGVLMEVGRSCEVRPRSPY
jgi:hypothetical protein